MKYKEIIESNKSAHQIFESINEKSAAGNIPRTGDYLRILEDMNGFTKGDEVEVVSFTDTSGSGDMSTFSVGVTAKGEGGKSATLTLERSDIDKKFQMVYDS
jgi:hypothetical protein